MFPPDKPDNSIYVENNADGKPLKVELRDADGKLLERETYQYDANGNLRQRQSFAGDGQLLDTELWTRDAEGRLVEHELRRPDNTLVFVEKWTRDAQGKLIYAEAWKYDQAGKQVGYKKLVPNPQGQLYNPRRPKSGLSAFRIFFLLVGGLCLFFAVRDFSAGNMVAGVLFSLLSALNFWSGVRKR